MLEQAVVAEVKTLDMFACREHRDDKLGIFDSLSRRRGALSTLLCQGLYRFFHEIKYRDMMASF